MPCTTVLVGKKANNENSTLIARTDDGHFDVKKLVIVEPEKQPRKYKSVIGHLEIELPDNPMRYTTCPSVDTSRGVWPASGINEVNVGMTATETTKSNPRVLAADPMVRYKKASSRKEKDVPGGIGEEDLVLLVLPYIHSAREGVQRLGSLLEKYGTYESNGIAFNDEDEVWWVETIGGHHWLAKRVKDDQYVINPNQFGVDNFDFDDAYGAQKENMCSKDLKEFVEKNHLDLNNGGEFNPRYCFGTHSDQDHIYNTPRAWFMAKYLNPNTYKWEGENADFTPLSDDIPWSLKPEKKVTVEDVKYLLSSYYQGTEYNPYSSVDNKNKAIYRSIGTNKTGVMTICQIRKDAPEAIKAVEWVCFGSCAFNALIPFYPNTHKVPKYLGEVTTDVDTSNFYWCSRLIGALADPCYGDSIAIVERYQNDMQNSGRQLVHEYDEKYLATKDVAVLTEANQKICDRAKAITTDYLNQLVFLASTHMKNGYNRNDN